MDVLKADRDQLEHLARLLWLHSSPEEKAQQSIESFAEDLAGWWTAHDASHAAFVAQVSETELVGMAWLALVPRVPRPGRTSRHSADIQSVFVLPEHRGKGIGAALVQAASAYAFRLGAGRVTVHSGRRAVPVYERLGFASHEHLLQLEAPASHSV